MRIVKRRLSGEARWAVAQMLLRVLREMGIYPPA